MAVLLPLSHSISTSEHQQEWEDEYDDSVYERCLSPSSEQHRTGPDEMRQEEGVYTLLTYTDTKDTATDNDKDRI